MNASLIVVWLVCAGLGFWIGKTKNRATLGLVLGLLLGIIGLIIIACLRAKAPEQAYPYAGTQGFGAPYPHAPGADQPPAHWAADPSGRHEHRWWSGVGWTDQVSDKGVTSVDAL